MLEILKLMWELKTTQYTECSVILQLKKLSKYVSYSYSEELGEYVDPGLCVKLKEHVDLIRPYFRSWAKYSGRVTYPVPHPTIDNYGVAYDTENRWGEDEYGDNRRDLARHLAECLTQNIISRHL